MWLLLLVAGLETVALGALVHWWRRPADAFLGGAAGKARWRVRLLLGLATAWLGIGLVPVLAYLALAGRARPDDEPTVEHASERAFVKATPATCFAVVTDFARYPEWAETPTVEVLERDADGRAARVAMERIVPMGTTVGMTTAYEYGLEPLEMRWRVIEVQAPPDADSGMIDAMSAMSASMRGRYRFEQNGDETLIAYDLSVALPPALPAFMAGRMVKMMAGRTVESLRARIDTLSADSTTRTG